MEEEGTVVPFIWSLSESQVINLHFFWHLINRGFDISSDSFGKKSIWLHSTCLATIISCPELLYCMFWGILMMILLKGLLFLLVQYQYIIPSKRFGVFLRF